MKLKSLIKKYQTNNPFELASLKKIHVFPWNLHNEIKGIYKYDKRNKYIFINNNLDEAFQRFVCSHELGHALLHPRSKTPFLREKTLFSLDKIEVEANTFAVELLLPDDQLYEYQNTNLSIYEICEMNGIPKGLSHLKIF
ncbi:hypothetical protein WQ54_31120 [Bacillus sp. SA1-12]|nr:hypothetical protein WQ54_31120 [Bacillus sp. SA1-12]